MQGVTQSGFAFSVSDDRLNNMELVDALAQSREDDPLAVSRVCLLLLGTEQRSALYDHLRLPDGRVPVDRVSQELVEVIKAFGDGGKNS